VGIHPSFATFGVTIVERPCEGVLVAGERASEGTHINVENIRQIDVALHDLCQPLTTLQCVLELAQVCNTPEAYREAVDTALAECTRLTAMVDSMREIIGNNVAVRASGSKPEP